MTNPKHNVHCFADALVKMGQGKIKVGHIISTREAGKEVACAHSKSELEINLVLYDESTDESTDQFTWPNQMCVTGWISVRKYIKEIDFKRKGHGL